MRNITIAIALALLVSACTTNDWFAENRCAQGGPYGSCLEWEKK